MDISEQLFGGLGVTRWKSLKHNGVILEAPYSPHKIPFTYDKKDVIINEQAEEMAMLFAPLTLRENVIDNKNFIKNFWKDWKKVLKDSTISEFEKCDFSKYVQIYLKKEN